MVGTVKESRLEEIFRYPTNEVPEQINREGKAIGGMCDPYPHEGARETQAVQQPEDGNEGHLQGHYQQPDNHQKQHVPPRKAHPRESVGCESRHQDGHHRGGNGDHQAVEEAPAHVRLQDDVHVVLYGESEGGIESIPPPSVQNKGPGAERADE